MIDETQKRDPVNDSLFIGAARDRIWNSGTSEKHELRWKTSDSLAKVVYLIGKCA